MLTQDNFEKVIIDEEKDNHYYKYVGHNDRTGEPYVITAKFFKKDACVNYYTPDLANLEDSEPVPTKEWADVLKAANELITKHTK